MIPLRPLGVGEILDGAISSVRAEPKTMIGLSLVCATVVQLVQVPVYYGLLRASTQEVFPTASSPMNSLLGAVLGAFAGLIVTGMLTLVVGRVVLGQRLGVAAAWRQVRPRLPTLLAIAGLLALLASGIVLVAVAPGALLAAAGAEGPGIALAVLGVILALLVLIYLFVTFALSTPAAVLEHQPARRALRRSRQLVRGSFWRVFGILALLNILAQLLASILVIPFVAILVAVFASVLSGGGGPSGAVLLLSAVLLALGTILASALTWPFTAAGTALVYIDLRMRREGLDIALARAAGVPAPGQPPSYGQPAQGQLPAQGQPGAPGAPPAGTGG